MKKNYLLLSTLIILVFFQFKVFSSDTTNVKDYTQDKFPSIFQFYLSSLEELDKYEKEFIDLLEKLPKEDQKCYAKEVYKNGFSLDLLNSVKKEYQKLTKGETCISVPFITQVPPGKWEETSNCGPVSFLMVYCYYKKVIPTKQDIENINDWFVTKGIWPNTNNYNGYGTQPESLKILAQEYGGFLDSYSSTRWNLEKIQQELNAGHPVIVAIFGIMPDGRDFSKIGHWIVVIGYTGTHFICNDPGTSKGKSIIYPKADFSKWMYGANNAIWDGAVVVLIPNEEEYTLQEEENLSVAVIMDRSGSMSGEKLAKEINAADAFVACLHNDEYSCLVTFSACARTEVGLLQATSENKTKFRAAIETVGAGGNTNIGAGLTNGLQQLTTVDESTPRTALLMSDGKHNTGELWPVVEEYELRGWPVHTVAYGSDADQENLENIAMRTGGTFFPADIFTISQIYQRISAYTHNQSVLFAYNDVISQGGKLDYQIPIDPDITSITFFVDWQGSVVDLHLQTPEEKKINPDNYKTFPGVDYQTGDTFCFYQVDEPKSGDWQATLYGKEIDRKSEQVNLTVSGSSPLLTNIFGLQPSYRRGEAIQIKMKIIDLFDSEQEILRDVKVTAKIKKPSPNLKKMLQKRVIDLEKLFKHALTGKKTIKLHDDGRHGDWRENDGIFGALFKDTDENGHYVITIKCEAIRPNGEKIVRTLKESVQVGSIEDRRVTLADFLGIK